MSSVTSERCLYILSQIVRVGQPSLATTRLCDVCAEMTATSGAGIMLIADGTSRGSVCTTNSVSELIEELQFTLGEGPCIDACRYGQPVLEPDLASATSDLWLAFAPLAIAAGARAVFGFPIRVGAARLGALSLYRDRPGPLTDEQHADALVLADVAAEFISSFKPTHRPENWRQNSRPAHASTTSSTRHPAWCQPNSVSPSTTQWSASEHSRSPADDHSSRSPEAS